MLRQGHSLNDPCGCGPRDASSTPLASVRAALITDSASQVKIVSIGGEYHWKCCNKKWFQQVAGQKGQLPAREVTIEKEIDSEHYLFLVVLCVFCKIYSYAESCSLSLSPKKRTLTTKRFHSICCQVTDRRATERASHRKNRWGGRGSCKVHFSCHSVPSHCCFGAS